MCDKNGQQSRGASVFRVAGPCVTLAGCDCPRYDGMSIADGAPTPPLHDKCFCYLEAPEQTELRKLHGAFKAELSKELDTIADETGKLIAAYEDGKWPLGPLLPLFKAVAGLLISIGKIEAARPCFLIKVVDGKLDESTAKRIREFISEVNEGRSCPVVIDESDDQFVDEGPDRDEGDNA